MEYAERHSFAFIETSARDATGVNEAFRQVLTGIHLLSLMSSISEIYHLMCRKKIAAQGQRAEIPAGSSINLTPEELREIEKAKKQNQSCC